ncbi:consortin-like [Tyto alba]|uniref:consortin-like n=1 Tax=Tyto alba TaxID=56313 RepID=UPI001C66803A|nr:consortin-like [Tyto alba]
MGGRLYLSLQRGIFRSPDPNCHNFIFGKNMYNIAPAEGLVSILKKRDDREGKTIAQVRQRQTKRRVRFQEMEDTLDQDEVAGGSCVLLILLCIATVFLSIGGTALYCTFGDLESPVCTDLAANTDFYYTQILRCMEELKHWIAFS